MELTEIPTYKSSSDNMLSEPIKVVHYNRHPGSRFSIENVFNEVRKHFPENIELVSVNSTFPNSGWHKKLWNLFEVLFRPKGDINHITGDVHYLAIFLPRRGTILTIHDLNLMYTKKGLIKWLHKWFWLRLPIARAEVVTAISETTKQEILKYVKCDPNKIKVVHDCISSNFKPFPKPFNEECPVILQIGTKPNKNLVRVAKALAGIKCKFVIIGKPCSSAFQALKQSNINYEWKENLNEAELIKQYQQCDMLVFASTFEGFGLPILEAQAIGRPIVTSNCSSMPEIAGDGAVFVDPFEVGEINKGILKIYYSFSHRKRIITKGANNVLRFKSELISHKYSKLYNPLIK